MKKYLSIVKSKIFWFLLMFALSSIALVTGHQTLGAIFMIYPVILTIIGLIFGAIVNPIREYKDHRRYLGYKSMVSGRVTCNNEIVDTVKVVVRNADGSYDIDTRNYFTVSNMNGNYSIPHIKAGKFICTAYHKGYLLFEKPFTISNSECVIINIELLKED